MGNHFHVLVRVPERTAWLQRFEGPEGEARLMRHLRLLYSKTFVAGLALELAEWRRNGRVAEAERCVADLKRRFCDISVFMRAVKLRFYPSLTLRLRRVAARGMEAAVAAWRCRWFNKRHGRRGTLWMGRFKSVLVQGKQTDTEGAQVDALKVMAAYIDLNCPSLRSRPAEWLC
jgi:putative transposase